MLACGLCVAAILFYYYIHARTYFVSVERPVSWLVRQVDLALALLESDLSSGACVHLRLGRSPCKHRLDFICVSRLGFLLRIARHRPISSTLPILLVRDWERDQDCFLGALLRIL